MIIAIDFDGTIVEHRYPEIGKPILFAFDAIKELRKRNHTLILWTYRYGETLEDAVEFCRDRGVEFDAVNGNSMDEPFEADKMSRKIHADVFIDDRNVGGFLGWGTILHELHPDDFGPPSEPLNFWDKMRAAWIDITRK